jgi:hypothetical protein
MAKWFRLLIDFKPLALTPEGLANEAGTLQLKKK